jgi:predicted permease
MNLVLSSLFPVFSLLFVGSLLRQLGLTNDIFLKTSDKLIYFIFFPILLFWKIGEVRTDTLVSWNLIVAALLSIALIYVISALSLKIFRVPDYKAGSFSQSCYRFNTYIGMAIIFYALGEKGIKHFGILIGFVIPFINLLAVPTLIWYSGRQLTRQAGLKVFFKEIVTNPLILACIAGLLYSRTIQEFPQFIENTFRLSSAVALPLALISIGGALSLKSLRGNFSISLVAAVIKLTILPCVGYLLLRILHVSGMSFKVGMIFFALPTSAAIYVLSSQLNSDTELASASVVVSTLFSFLSLTSVLLLCQ